MRYASIFAAGHRDNSLFGESDPNHLYNPTYLMRRLRAGFSDIGIEINTRDRNSDHDIEFEVYVEGQALTERKVPKYLLALENPHINPLNASKEYCLQFNHVFTWNPFIGELPNSTVLMAPNELRIQAIPTFAERALFSCLINANKRFKTYELNDLYEERLKVIRWYEAYHPIDFELYGLGWDKPSPAFTTAEKLLRRVNRLRSQLLAYRPFPSFVGPIANKDTVLLNAKFSFCYENVKDLPNYITEKIFDSFMAGCVPIYWGANNVTNYIPQECFIDRRDFDSMETLHRFLKGIDSSKYQSYQDAIAHFLQSSQMQLFDADQYVGAIAQIIDADLKMV
jgi:alpha(1,3/1,4) fucosyltransferase